MVILRGFNQHTLWVPNIIRLVSTRLVKCHVWARHKWWTAPLPCCAPEWLKQGHGPHVSVRSAALKGSAIVVVCPWQAPAQYSVHCACVVPLKVIGSTAWANTRAALSPFLSSVVVHHWESSVHSSSDQTIELVYKFTWQTLTLNLNAYAGKYELDMFEVKASLGLSKQLWYLTVCTHIVNLSLTDTGIRLADRIKNGTELQYGKCSKWHLTIIRAWKSFCLHCSDFDHSFLSVIWDLIING